jgi:hypothetical protein
MKKTITFLLLVSSQTYAEGKSADFIKKEYRTACFQTYTNADSSVSASDCDSAKNNKIDKLKIAENGCAQGQVAIRVHKSQVISSCLPSGVVQL